MNIGHLDFWTKTRAVSSSQRSSWTFLGLPQSWNALSASSWFFFFFIHFGFIYFFTTLAWQSHSTVGIRKRMSIYAPWGDIVEPTSVQLSHNHAVQRFAIPERGKSGIVPKIVEITDLKLERYFSILCNLVECVYDLPALLLHMGTK